MKDLSISVKVASLPEDDPFDFILKKGMREFMSIVDSALAPADYKIKRVLSVIRTDQMQTLLALFEVVRELQYDSERSEYLKKIASLTGYDQKMIFADFQKFTQKGERPIISVKPLDAKVKKDDYLTRSYRDLIVLLMHNPGLLNKAVLDFSAEDFADPLQRNIFNRMCELYNDDENLSVDKLFDIFREGEEKRFLEENVSISSLVKNQDDAYTELYLNIRQYSFETKIVYFDDLIRSNPLDPRVKDYLNEIDMLRRKKEELSAYVYNMKKAP